VAVPVIADQRVRTGNGSELTGVADRRKSGADVVGRLVGMHGRQQPTERAPLGLGQAAGQRLPGTNPRHHAEPADVAPRSLIGPRPTVAGSPRAGNPGHRSGRQRGRHQQAGR
jgi:hypothetical protein